MTSKDPFVDELLRLQKLIRWCQQRRIDPRAVIDGRIVVDLPDDIRPSRAVRAQAVRSRAHSVHRSHP